MRRREGVMLFSAALSGCELVWKLLVYLCDNLADTWLFFSALPYQSRCRIVGLMQAIEQRR